MGRSVMSVRANGSHSLFVVWDYGGGRSRLSPKVCFSQPQFFVPWVLTFDREGTYASTRPDTQAIFGIENGWN